MTYIPQVNFHFIESIIGPRRREYVIQDILTINNLVGMQEFVKQTNKKCLDDVKRAMKQLQITKDFIAELTETQFYRFWWEPEQFNFRQGHKQNLCAIYLNSLQRPELFKELTDATPGNRRKTLTQEQTETLMKFYEKKQYPTRMERERLARILTPMTPHYPRNEKNVLKWFQNRREKDEITRKQGTSRPSSNGSLCSSISSSSVASSSTFSTPMVIDLTIDE